MTAPYARTIYATDSASAQAAVKVLAKRDGYRVVEVVRVRRVPEFTENTLAAAADKAREAIEADR